MKVVCAFIAQKVMIAPGRCAKGVVACRSGSVAVVFAIVLPILIGIGALAIDVSQWYWEQRNLQSAADAGAVSGALELGYTGTTEALARARMDTARNDIGNTAVVTVESPPTTGAFAGDAAAITVSINKPMPLYLARIMGLGAISVSVTSTARVSSSGSDPCILGLDTTIEGAVTVNGNGSVTMDCGVAANSSHAAAVDMASGSAEMSVTDVNVVGGVSNRWGKLTTSGSISTSSAAVDDPYGDVDVTPPAGCDEQNFKLNNNANVTLSPGTYCGGMSLKGTVDLAPGTYYIKGGDLQINASATVTGDDVTLVLTNDGSDFATINKINGGANVELEAPTTGDFAGLAIIQDRDAPSCTGGGCNRVNGGSDLNIKGAIYIPNQSIDFTGNSDVTNNPNDGCLQIVARQVLFSGNSALTNADCENAGVKKINVGVLAGLVE